MAVLKALASRTAVLLSPGCHFPAVEQAGAGRIADAEPEALAGTALAELLARPERLKAMGQAGLELVQRRCSSTRSPINCWTRTERALSGMRPSG